MKWMMWGKTPIWGKMPTSILPHQHLCGTCLVSRHLGYLTPLSSMWQILGIRKQELGGGRHPYWIRCPWMSYHIIFEANTGCLHLTPPSFMWHILCIRKQDALWRLTPRASGRIGYLTSPSCMWQIFCVQMYGIGRG